MAIRLTLFSSNWPICSVEEIFESPFYPSTKSAAFSTLWIAFDPSTLLPGLQANSSHGNDSSKLIDRIGHLPYQLVKALSFEHGPHVERKCEPKLTGLPTPAQSTLMTKIQ